MRVHLPLRLREPLLLAALLVALALIIGAGFMLEHRGPRYPEAGELAGVSWSFQEYSNYFQKLADTKGALYAFGVLREAPFPEGTDLHLLAHVVGDMLYKQQGIDGITSCTDEFRNACSHSVVIGVLNDRGPAALPEIAETCKKAPGGKGAYGMCFHGLGHGALAYTGYDLKKAIDLCKMTGTPEYRDREYIECVGGATMEMIAGVHDRSAWEKQYANYFSASDPLAPCDASYFPDEVRPICYVHLTPQLFTDAGIDLHAPDPALFASSFAACERIPASRTAERAACYGGFGKEFIAIAGGRDIRNVGAMPPERVSKIREWCALAGNADGEAACDSYALASLFWGGESNPDAAFSFCADAASTDACYAQLAGHISYYLGETQEGGELCRRLPEPYRATCLANLGA